MGKPTTARSVVLRPEHIGPVEGTRGIETSQYPEERKATATPLVAASETGISLNRAGAIAWWRCRYGVVGPSGRRTRVSAELQSCYLAEAFWNVVPKRVRVPYAKGKQPPSRHPSSAGSVKVGVNLRRPLRKAKY